MKIGILSSGGDCPGINATIRGVGKSAIMHYGMEVIGIHSGFQGLLTKDVESFTDKSLSGLLNLGGTMLGTSREKPFKKNGVVSDVNKPALIERNVKELGLDCIVCIGGNGTQKTAAKLAAMGLNIVSVPKTIDNDIWGTDFSFGFDSAVSIATDAIDRLHSTASSHKRVMVIEVMGHKAGWIALYSGMAGGGDVISQGISGVVPEGNRFIGVVAYCLGMMIFTMIMGNGFAAFTVITAGIGVPFVMAQGGDPVVAGALAMTAGFCGTLLTPMAANFNALPVALLEMKDPNGVIKAQAPIAFLLLVIHIALMYFWAF